MAGKLEITNKQSAAFLEMLTDVAVKEAKKNGVFVVPGLVRLKKVQRKARMGRNPQTGAAIKIKAKTVAKFYVAKSVKNAISPPTPSTGKVTGSDSVRVPVRRNAATVNFSKGHPAVTR